MPRVGGGVEGCGEEGMGGIGRCGGGGWFSFRGVEGLGDCGSDDLMGELPGDGVVRRNGFIISPFCEPPFCSLGAPL